MGIKKSLKMYKLYTSIILLTLSVFLAFSCSKVVEDPAVDYVQLIENKSKVSLLLVTSTSTNLDSAIIPIDEEYILLDLKTIGTIRHFQNCETGKLGVLSIEVEPSDSLIVNIDPNQSSNWHFTMFEEFKNGGGSGECRLVINDQNIE